MAAKRNYDGEPFCEVAYFASVLLGEPDKILVGLQSALQSLNFIQIVKSKYLGFKVPC